MRLLIVDDDDVDRMAVVRVLQQSNTVNEIVHASTAMAGLKYFGEQSFDAVLLDYCLPDMDCLAALAEFTKNPGKHAAVLILTGITDSDESLERQCIVAGAQDFLMKRDLSQRHLTKALLHAQMRQEQHRQLIATHNRLKYLAENDTMTGLANRYAFDVHLHSAIQRSLRTNEQLGLLFIDIDNFKLVNDSLGHDMGDCLLKEVAQRLCLVARDGDVVGRLGGDEFAIIAHNIDSEASLGFLAQRILESLHKLILLDKSEHFITCSIGISSFPRCANTAEDMLKKADMAMYQVKREGRNGFHFFTEKLQVQVMHRITLEGELRSQRLQQQLSLHYQPVINAKTFQVCGAEMLMRWDHPAKGMLLPREFIDVVQELGFLGDFDTVNRRQACQQLARWRADGVVDEHFVIAINASDQLLRQDTLPSAILDDLQDAGLPCDCMTIEVTEGVLVLDFAKTSELLSRIKALGLNISIDDFGTGYSSMAYLKWLPASTLKVDQSFVQNVPHGDAECRVLKAIITMAKSLGLEVIVEGVQTLEQAQFCRSCGADKLQGFLFSQALLPTDFATFLKTHNAQSFSLGLMQ